MSARDPDWPWRGRSRSSTNQSETVFVVISLSSIEESDAHRLFDVRVLQSFTKFIKRDVIVPLKEWEKLLLHNETNTLFIFYKNVIFWPKPSKEIEIATNKITTMFLILEYFEALMFL